MNRAKLRLAALAVGLVFAGTAAGADFLATYRLAKQNDAAFASARASLEAGLEKLPQGRALLLPVINASGNTTWNDDENRVTSTGVTNSGQFSSNGWNVTLTQPLFRWQNLVQYQQSQFQVLQAEAQFGQATQDLIVRVAQAYFDVLAAQDNLEFTKSNRVVIAEQLAQAKRNFEVGTATITDTNEAQARYDLAIAQEIAGVNALEVAQRALQQIIVQFPDALTPLRSQVMIEQPQPNVMDEWVKGARGNNFVVRGNEAVMEIASREVERQRAGHYPTLDVVAAAQENTNQNLAALTAGGQRATLSQNTIGLQLNVPIYAGGSVMSRTREAVGLKEKARQDLDSSRRAAEFNARQSFLNVTNGIAQVRALEQALRSSEVSLQSNRVGYEVGVRINIDVLNAQQQVFQTQRDLARARYDTILNGLRLKSAAGSLTEQDVEAVNRLLGYDQKPPATAPAPRSGQLERTDQLARAEESPAPRSEPLDLSVPGAVASDAPVIPSVKPDAANAKTPPARKVAAAKPRTAPARVQPVATRPAPLTKPAEPLPAEEVVMVPAPMARAIDEPVAPVGKPLIEAAAVTTPAAEPGEESRIIRYVEPKIPSQQ
jgi:outer membrane protein